MQRCANVGRVAGTTLGVSTLSDHLEAIGARLELVAVFEDDDRSVPCTSERNRLPDPRSTSTRPAVGAWWNPKSRSGRHPSVARRCIPSGQRSDTANEGQVGSVLANSGQQVGAIVDGLGDIHAVLGC